MRNTGTGEMAARPAPSCWRPSFGPRLPAPKQAKSLSVPADERIGLHDDEGVLPVEHSGQRRHRESRGVIVRRGVCSRSTKKVSCFRRKRFSAARALWEHGRLRTNAMASRTMGTIFERSRKSEPFHVQNDDDPVVVPVGAKQPILAGLSRGINAGSSFCGPQGRHQGSPHRSWDRRHYAELRAEVAEWHLGVFYRFCQRGSPTSLASSTAPRTRQR